MGLKFVPDNTKFKFVSKRLFCFCFSAFIFLGTATSLYVNGLNFGIDFSGGILIEMKTEKPAELAKLRHSLGDAVSLQNIGSNREVLIKVPLEAEQHDQGAYIENIKEKIRAVEGVNVDFRKVEFVGPRVGEELIQAAVVALLASFAAIMLYVWFRFEWQYGIGGILALTHDAVAVMGFYSITQIEFDLTSVAAVLTVVGFSINDSVVIFDRIRENLRRYKKMPIGELIDQSVNETLSRTIMTSGTMLLALVALTFFGGPALFSFSSGMLVGVVIGTFSSIYVSAIILMYLNPRGKDALPKDMVTGNEQVG